MFALLIILAVLTVVAGSFAIVIHQIAQARRQQYLEEAALNSLGCAQSAEFERKASRQAAASIRTRMAAQKAPRRPQARHPHSPLLVR